MFRVDSIDGNSQALDGGAMFGNCPRPIWESWASPDTSNRIRLACRALLIRDGERNVLLETGVGSFLDPKLRERYGVMEPTHVLLQSLKALGLEHDDIDVVVLSHLHFDHAGGLFAPYEAGAPARLLFPRATFVVGRPAWDRARRPHLRDRASFIPELVELLEKSNQVEIIEQSSAVLPEDIYRFSFSNGHTPGMTMTTVRSPFGPITFVSDLMPGTPWVHLPITMGYDRYPELLVDEKRAVLDRIIGDDGWIFYTHDPKVAISKVGRTESGRYAPTNARAKVAWCDDSLPI
jgi:glyoxylase-like metal-dependent hydrolase (beta-lactamase superfamily II)